MVILMVVVERGVEAGGVVVVGTKSQRQSGGCGLVDLQSRDEEPLHADSSTTCGRKRGSLTGP